MAKKKKVEKIVYYTLDEIPPEKLDNVLFDENNLPVLARDGHIRMKGGRPKGSIKKKVGRPKGIRNGEGQYAAQYGSTSGFTKTAELTRCSCCGTAYIRPDKIFPKTRSLLYANNGFYVPICYNCVQKLYIKLRTEENLNDSEAVRLICQKLDVYFEESALKLRNNVEDALTVDNRFGKYLQSLAIKELSGTKTYTDNYLEEKRYIEGMSQSRLEKEFADNNIIVKIDGSNGEKIIEDIKSTPNEKIKEAPKKARELFGSSFNDIELSSMWAFYKSYQERYENMTAEQVELVITMARMKTFKERSLASNSVKSYNDADEIYIRSLKNFESLKAKDVVEEDVSTVGVNIALIEKYTPAEYYRDKKLFKDFDGIGDYIERQLVRPVKNFFTGNRVMDSKNSIEPDDKLEAGTVSDSATKTTI